MELRRVFVGSMLILVAVHTEIVRGGLICACTERIDCWVNDNSRECDEGELCAIQFDRHREGSRAYCSGDLPVGACSGDLNNETRYIACCNQSLCTRAIMEPIYTTRQTTTTVDPLTTESTNADVTVVLSRSDRNDSGNPGIGRLYFGLTIGVPCSFVACILLVLLSTYIYYRRLRRDVKKRRPKLVRSEDGVSRPDALSIHIDYKEDVPRVEDGTSTCSSGSGSGMPLLTQRTVARTIKLGDRIGSGRFGQVFLGDYQGEKVAVKKFVSHDDKSWARETEVYNTVYLIHDNILGFFASDMVSNNGVTELWLITQYHPHGSLYDYLNREAISSDVMLRMITSCCCGLAHLHMELPGTYRKPAIAHRDLKSRNLLVKENLECCIADFGLAVMKDEGGLSLPTNPRQGTKRYMAPEILGQTINMERFESFKQADVYSLGLVMWEICRRCILKDGIALEYELPFQGMVPPDPSFEDMRRLVVEERRRPTIPEEWLKDVLLERLSKVMQECWHLEGVARPTAVNLKKRATRFSEQLQTPAQNCKSVTSIVVTE